MNEAYPGDATGDVFRRMQESAFDFAIPHDVDFYALFPTEEAADVVAHQYLEDHKAGAPLLEIETRPSDQGGMELKLVINMFVTYENVTRIEAELTRRAAGAGGHSDGWGVMQPTP